MIEKVSNEQRYYDALKRRLTEIALAGVELHPIASNIQLSGVTSVPQEPAEKRDSESAVEQELEITHLHRVKGAERFPKVAPEGSRANDIAARLEATLEAWEDDRCRIAYLRQHLEEAEATAAAFDSCNRARQTAESELASLRERVKGNGIYVASRASIPEMAKMWRDLRAEGIPIVSTWIDEAGEGETADLSALWVRISREVASAQALVLYAGPSHFSLKGALIEVGMALAHGKPVFAVLPMVDFEYPSMRPVGSWLRHPLVTICDSTHSAIRSALAAPTPGTEEKKG